MAARSLLATLILLGAAISSLGAQVRIQVVDANGAPVPDVRIDVFGRGELIGVDSTSTRGVAELSTTRWSEVRRLSLSHIGFQTRIVQAEDIPTDGLIRLEPRAIEIDGLAVEGRELCPAGDDPAARRLWADVAARYADDTGSRARSAYFSLYGESVREDAVLTTPDIDSRSTAYVYATGPGVIHGGDHTPRSLDARVESEGYAWPPLVIGGLGGGRALAWAYPELDRAHAYHFAGPAFGALHDFAVAGESDGRTTLIFCANEKGVGATVEGVLDLVPDRGFLSASWRFETSGPDEGAGGWVVFDTVQAGHDARPHLVASRGIFFRHSGTESPYPDLPRTYMRSVTARARWTVHPTGERPCNTGTTFHLDPPDSPDGERFVACVATHWGRDPG